MEVKIKREYKDIFIDFFKNNKLQYHFKKNETKEEGFLSVIIDDINSQKAFLLGARLQRYLSDETNLFAVVN